MTIEPVASNDKYAIRIGILFINLGSLLAQIVQIAGYPTLLAITMTGINYPSWAIGLLLSFQWVVVLVLAPVAPAIMRRCGIRQTCQLGTVLSVASLMLLLVSHSTAAIALSALLMGAGLTVRWVACDTWLVQAVPEKLRGRAIGIHETLMGLGIAIGPLLTMFSNGNETIASSAYIVILTLSFFSFVFGTKIPTATVIEGEHKGQPFSAVFRLLTLALIGTLAAGYIETAVIALLPLYLVKFSYSESQALIFLSLFGLGGTVLQIPLGWIADRWSFRIGQILCQSLIILSCVTLMLMISTPLIVAVTLFIWGGCVGGLNTLAVIEAGSTLDSKLSGTGMALIASSYTLGSVVGPVASGATLNLWSGHGAIVLILALMIIYAGITAIYARRLG